MPKYWHQNNRRNTLFDRFCQLDTAAGFVFCPVFFPEAMAAVGCRNSRDQRVKTGLGKLCFILLLLQSSSALAGVDCSAVPHTRLELNICGDPTLRALDSELTAALDEARDSGLMTRDEITSSMNAVAQQCRRETNDTFKTCLLDAELRSLSRVMHKLDQAPPGSGFRQGSGLLSTPWKYDPAPSALTARLEVQISLAQVRARNTGDPALLVQTLISLLTMQRQMRGSADEDAAAIAVLQKRIAAGCDHSIYGNRWRALLKSNELSCGLAETPALISSSNL